VYAAQSALHNRGYGELEMSALCHFTLEGEVFASASIEYLRPSTAPTHGDDRVRVAGTEGVIEVRGGEVWLVREGEPGARKLEAACERQIFQDFIDHIEGKRPAWLGPRDTFDVTEACLLARQSADEGRIVRFEEEGNHAA
jgi:predicted dehydrogenase